MYNRMYVRPQTMRRPNAAPMPMSDKQRAFLTKLAAERGAPMADDTLATMTKSQASQAIDFLLTQPTKPRAAAAAGDATQQGTTTTRPPVTEMGMYRDADGIIYKVQESQTTGNLYAKALTAIKGQRLNEQDEIVRWEFAYAPGAMRTLSADDRLSIDDAKAFGIRYGVCCVCGRTLSDAKSVAAGIGPICAKNV
jgi:hypothetical protein